MALPQITCACALQKAGSPLQIPRFLHRVAGNPHDLDPSVKKHSQKDQDRLYIMGTTAYKKENSKVAVRMPAVLMILKDGKDIQYAAKTLHRCTNRVRRRASRFGEYGLDGLYGLPRSGRPETVSKKGMDCIMSKATLTLFTPVMLQQSIFYSTGTRFHITHIRKIMHQLACLQKLHKDITSIMQCICCEKLAATHQKENFT